MGQKFINLKTYAVGDRVAFLFGSYTLYGTVEKVPPRGGQCYRIKGGDTIYCVRASEILHRARPYNKKPKNDERQE